MLEIKRLKSLLQDQESLKILFPWAMWGRLTLEMQTVASRLRLNGQILTKKMSGAETGRHLSKLHKFMARLFTVRNDILPQVLTQGLMKMLKVYPVMLHSQIVRALMTQVNIRSVKW